MNFFRYNICNLIIVSESADTENFVRIIMKRILSVILVVIAVFSLTACSSEEYLKITAPGTYELQIFSETNKQQKGEYPASKYLRVVAYGLGDGIKYISRAEAYGCSKVGANITVENPWIFPATYTNAKVTVEVTISYRTYVSRFNQKTYTSEPQLVEIELDENGKGTAAIMIDPDPDVATHTYFDGLVHYVNTSPAWDAIKIDAIGRIVAASGTVTFYEKVDPTVKPTVTATPAE